MAELNGEVAFPLFLSVLAEVTGDELLQGDVDSRIVRAHFGISPTGLFR